MKTKNEIIKDGTYKNYLQLKKEKYLNQENDNIFNKSTISNEDLKTCERIYNSQHTRKKRNFDNIIKWLFAKENIKRYENYKIIFGTLTFTDKTLSKTNEKTRRRYITRYLKNETDYYIANIDFGEQKQREHYHFLAFTKENIKGKNWKYGSNKLEEVKINAKNIAKTKNYLLKLNNHSFKESTRQKNIIKDKNQLLEKIINVMYLEEYKIFKIKILDEIMKK